MGFWDVLLFNIATVLGLRWIAAAGHNGTSSISLWAIAELRAPFDKPTVEESHRGQLWLRGYPHCYSFWQGSSKP